MVDRYNWQWLIGKTVPLRNACMVTIIIGLILEAILITKITWDHLGRNSKRTSMNSYNNIVNITVCSQSLHNYTEYLIKVFN